MTLPRSNTQSRLSGWPKKIDALLEEGGIKSVLYNEVCTGTKVLLFPKSWADTTISKSAVEELLSSGRIFADMGEGAARVRSRVPKDGKDLPEPCDLSASALGSFTVTEAMQNERMGEKALKYIGNWVIMRVTDPRKPPGARPRYITVCGFYDCSGTTRERLNSKAKGKTKSDLRVERLVKHMNLCRYARDMHARDMDARKEPAKDVRVRYMVSGSFVIGTNGPRDRTPEIIVNVRSGSWALAKTYLYSIGFLSQSHSNIDEQMAAFARPKVTEVIKWAVAVHSASLAAST